ncbi:MAG: division/cell wall cluster transcriptional repressor MraZ [Cytophagaceae bacterium]|jgi:MraZ protein|nr:division/cell wall cluster transcriptional repressor MraZ [Cytophagaceae bacterium]
MITFIGDFECRADAKGRIVLPSAFKKVDGQDNLCFVARKHLFENCLELYPYNHWEELLEQLRKKLNPYNRKHDQLMRSFFKSAAELPLDGNGRFLVPRRLMEQIGAERDVVLVGIDKKIELWAQETYNSMGDNTEILASLAENILGKDETENF